VVVSCSIVNQSAHPVVSMKGILRFSTYLGRPLVEIPMEGRLKLAPGAETSLQQTLRRDDFRNEEAYRKFLRTPLARLRQEWVPTELVLADRPIQAR
jgi:hypothetical protein